MEQTVNPLYLIGGGGHAVSVLMAVPPGERVAGYVDFRASECMPVPYAGTDDEFLSGAGADCARVHIAVVAGTDMSLRRKIIDRYGKLTPASVIAPSAIVTSGSEIGAGTAVMHGSVVNGAHIGRHCIINTGAVVEHGVTLGSNVFVGPGAVICGGVTVGDDVFIGAGATVRNCVSIASGCTVGLGAAVTRSLDEPGTYTGVPARKVKGKEAES